MCVSSEDLDIVKITINFWFILSEELISTPRLLNQFAPMYESLISVIIKQMRYPNDVATMTSQERDDFRDFRHDIGDVLKDCVRVLGEDRALQIPYSLLLPFFNVQTQEMSQNWQEIEAPLFSLRTMCKEISMDESKYIPEIMAYLPKLPDHPKIQYAAILVIGRYAHWTDKHPDMIPYQLDFVSKGFVGVNETSIAAAHAFRDLCKFCSKHLVPFFDKLQPFYASTLQIATKTNPRIERGKQQSSQIFGTGKLQIESSKRWTIRIST
jgi:transportin-3